MKFCPRPVPKADKFINTRIPFSILSVSSYHQWPSSTAHDLPIIECIMDLKSIFLVAALMSFLKQIAVSQSNLTLSGVDFRCCTLFEPPITFQNKNRKVRSSALSSSSVDLFLSKPRNVSICCNVYADKVDATASWIRRPSNRIPPSSPRGTRIHLRIPHVVQQTK